jgi:hypothetical protein
VVVAAAGLELRVVLIDARAEGGGLAEVERVPATGASSRSESGWYRPAVAIGVEPQPCARMSRVPASARLK